MNVTLARGSQAERIFRKRSGLPGGRAALSKAIAPGLHPSPQHDLRFFGGKTIKDLTFMNFYIGGQGVWKQSDIQNIDRTLAAAMSDRSLNNVMMQYFGEQPITTVSKPSQVLPGTKPSAFSQGDVEALARRLRRQGKMKGFDLSSTVFNFILPSGTVLNTDTSLTHAAAPKRSRAARVNPARPEDEVSSLHGLGGYHGSVHPTKRTTIYYAIGVYSESLPDGTENGIVAFDAPWKNVVATFYHELNEARTDCDVEDAIKAGNDPNGAKFLGWMSRQGEECGDFPIFESGGALNLVMKEVPLGGGGTAPVQFQYSNAVHGPEGPIPAPHPVPPH
jgi:hypothetical protein